ncbi:MAG TPA: ABC transporter substrate-binding protein [Caldisericia bacterium]|nr:ABC transporter substrate-binding protein [Caldisericia bacterium]HOL82974.1 ABC transporter substrate-binding protein [Caldisericia bacterium]HON82996.1 ABC transporter substrate-binding protein [Caldisericia bacterium]HPP43676.1 ABC transporter substrate-binding protein [Caldisericia bacterium]
MFKRLYLTILIMLLFIGLISFTTGCQTKKENVEVIKIGGVGPVSGEASTFGISTRNGEKLAVEEWNAKGGVLGKKIELIFEDDKGEAAEAATVWTELIDQEKVVAIVGSVMSKCSLAGAPIAQAKGVPVVSSGSTNPRVTECGDYIFRVCFIDSFQGKVGANFAFNDLGVRKVGAIFDIGNDYTKGLAEFFRDQFINLGGEVVGFESHPTGATDFKAQLTNLIKSGAELIYIPDYYSDAALIMKQARELGFKGYFLGSDGWDSPDLVKIGGDAVEGGFFTNHFSKDEQRPEVQEFVKKYKEKFGQDPDALASLAYDAMNITLTAIQNAGSTDGAKIKEALKNMEFNGVTGFITFDENRNPIKSVVILEIKNGQQTYRATVNP